MNTSCTNRHDRKSRIPRLAHMLQTEDIMIHGVQLLAELVALWAV